MQNPRKRQTWRGAGVAGLFLLGAAGCSSLSGASKASHTVNADQLAQAPANVMAPVKAQQAAIDEATRGREDAVRSQEDAERHVRLAQTDIDAANAELKRVEAEAGLLHKQYDEAQKPAGSSGSTMSRSNLQDVAQRMGKADMDVRDAKARVDAEELKLDYIKSLAGFEGAKVNVADKRIELEKAKLERARFEALKLSQPEVAQDQKMNPAEFDAVIADREADLASANADVAKARSEATAKYRTWVARGETLIPSGQERANVPPPPKG